VAVHGEMLYLRDKSRFLFDAYNEDNLMMRLSYFDFFLTPFSRSIKELCA
jgi:hypothetical protein